jgi:hypothetical protein
MNKVHDNRHNFQSNSELRQCRFSSRLRLNLNNTNSHKNIKYVNFSVEVRVRDLDP